MADPAFRNVPKGQSCFLIWRIEDFQPVPVPREQYGSFYDGDSYIVLCAYPRGQTDIGAQQKEVKGVSLDVKIHFWLGQNTTQDESGAAAIKSVELDDYLGGYPEQYRETQGAETKVFLNYFRSSGGIKYLTGGHASGFTHVEVKHKPRLLHVKGKHCPRIKEIEMNWSSMNAGDSYILDIGEMLFVYNGQACSRIERIKAMEYARKLRDERGHGNIVVVEQGEESVDNMGNDEYEVFDEYLSVKDKAQLQSASQGGSDDAFEAKAHANLKLWKCSDEGGQLKVEEISSKPLKKEMLDTNDVFIVDNGEAGIWVWCGRKASKTEKTEGMANGMAFLQQRNYPSHVQVIKVHEKAEPTEFKVLFKVWEKEKLPGSQKPHTNNKIAHTVQTKFDAKTLHEQPNVARDTGMVDDGSGMKTVYRIERNENTYDMVEVRKFNNEMYGGDSYVIHYTYRTSGKENHIIYFWLGRKSTQDEKGVAAMKTVELDDSLGGAAKQVRVVHGKEPNHFLAIFQGKLIIFSGGKAGWGQAKDEEKGDTYLMQVRGTNTWNTKAEQVPCRAESLNSNDVFVLFSKTVVFIWAGKGCTGDEREMAKNVASISPRGYTLIIEGQEKDEFWQLLGGKTEYSTSPRLTVEEEARPARLFQCSNASGVFQIEEIVDFSQVDLVPEDVFLLDAFDSIYIWVGADSRPEEKSMSCDAAIEYLESDPAGRDSDTAIYIVKQGFEDPVFVGYFGFWDRELWSSGQSYEDLKKQLGDKNIEMAQVKQKSSVGGQAFSDVAKVPYEKLKSKDDIPEGVDLTQKEKYLSENEFRDVFKMSYQEFICLPAWKQKNLKQARGLF